MEKLKFILLCLSVLFFARCGSNTEKENTENFELQVYEEPEEDIKPFQVANIMPYFKDGKWGYANKQGEIVIPCKYDACGFFFEGLAWVEKDWRFGYIDTTGHLFIQHQYLNAGNFKYGMAIVKSNKYQGIIDKNNKLIIPFEYEELNIGENGLIVFKQNQQWGLLTANNVQIVNPIYNHAFTFENGFAVVSRNNKQGAINRAGKEVVMCKYDEVIPTRGVFFIVMNRDQDYHKQYGVVDSIGKILIPVGQKKVEEAINNTFIVTNESGAAIISHKLDTLVNFDFNEIRSGNTNLLAAKTNKGWGFINLKGDTILPFEFSDAQGFIGNFAIVQKQKGYGLINSLGETIIPLEFEEIKYTDKEILKVYNKEQEYGFYNTKCERLTDCIYDEIDYSISGNERQARYMDGNYESYLGMFFNNYAIVGVNGRFGAIDKKGNEIIKPYYHQLRSFDENGLTVASYNGAQALINSHGKVLTGFKYKFINRDDASGYYYANYLINKDRSDWEFFNAGYFNLDGTYFSNATNGTVNVEMEEDMILAIRKEYQRITAEISKEKGKTVNIDENTTATMKSNMLSISYKTEQVNYEYYYADNLNQKGPFFILKTDKSADVAKYDRYYYKNGHTCPKVF